MSLSLVGRVAALWRYPVKSMAGEPVDAIEVSWHGFAGDRRWGFVQDALAGSGFPWLTIRERPKMGFHRAAFLEPERPDSSAVVVTTPSGRVLDILDPALAAALGGGARVIKQNRGLFDTMPLSLIGTRTIERIGELAQTGVDARRFRPNLVIEAVDDAPFVEDSWVGAVLHIGRLRLRVDQRDKRCIMINVDPDSGRRNPEILRVVARERDARLGVYGTTVQPGRVAIGDAVLIERAA